MTMTILGIAAASFVVVSAAAATGVALFQRDPKRRADALQVLRIVLSTGAVAGGAGATLIKLHEAGIF